MSNTSSYEKNNPDNLKHNGITIDSEFLTQEPITIPSNGSAVSIDETGSGSKWQDFKDSFKRVKPIEVDPNLSEAEKVAIITAQTPLKHHLKNRHLQMIAIGGAIGTGLLVGSGTALRTGGPASLMIGWGSTGTMIYAMVMALGELAVIFPISGGFTTYATRFLDESFGYANNFNYMLQWLVVLPL